MCFTAEAISNAKDFAEPGVFCLTFGGDCIDCYGVAVSVIFGFYHPSAPIIV